VKQEFKALTSLRIFAAFLAFTSHAHAFGTEFPHRTSDLFKIIVFEGHIGVVIFFVLSGFLITLRYQQTFEEGKFSFGDYLIKRFARIYPLYFVVTFISLAELGISVFSPQAISMWTLTHGYFDNYRFGVNDPAWTLSVEESFYLLAPLILLSANRLQPRRGGWWVGVAGILLGWISITALIGWLLHTLSVQSGLSSVAGFVANWSGLLRYTIFGALAQFVIGVMAALIYRRYQNVIWNTAWKVHLSTGLIIVSWLGIIGTMVLINVLYGDLMLRWLCNYLVALWSGVLIFALTCEQSFLVKALSYEPLVYLGRVSYAFYLLHLSPAIYWLRGSLNAEHSWYWPTLLLLFLGASVLCYEVIEKPARTAILELAKRFQQRQSLKTERPAVQARSGD
jgi:peptidoglycan/LPS O-acetylase OafA/YrhL